MNKNIAKLHGCKPQLNTGITFGSSTVGKINQAAFFWPMQYGDAVVFDLQSPNSTIQPTLSNKV